MQFKNKAGPCSKRFLLLPLVLAIFGAKAVLANLPKVEANLDNLATLDVQDGNDRADDYIVKRAGLVPVPDFNMYGSPPSVFAPESYVGNQGHDASEWESRPAFAQELTTRQYQRFIDERAYYDNQEAAQAEFDQRGKARRKNRKMLDRIAPSPLDIDRVDTVDPEAAQVVENDDKRVIRHHNSKEGLLGLGAVVTGGAIACTAATGAVMYCQHRRKIKAQKEAEAKVNATAAAMAALKQISPIPTVHNEADDAHLLQKRSNHLSHQTNLHFNYDAPLSTMPDYARHEVYYPPPPTPSYNEYPTDFYNNAQENVNEDVDNLTYHLANQEILEEKPSKSRRPRKQKSRKQLREQEYVDAVQHDAISGTPDAGLAYGTPEGTYGTPGQYPAPDANGTPTTYENPPSDAFGNRGSMYHNGPPVKSGSGNMKWVGTGIAGAGVATLAFGSCALSRYCNGKRKKKSLEANVPVAAAEGASEGSTRPTAAPPSASMQRPPSMPREERAPSRQESGNGGGGRGRGGIGRGEMPTQMAQATSGRGGARGAAGQASGMPQGMQGMPPQAMNYGAPRPQGDPQGMARGMPEGMSRSMSQEMPMSSGARPVGGAGGMGYGTQPSSSRHLAGYESPAVTESLSGSEYDDDDDDNDYEGEHHYEPTKKYQGGSHGPGHARYRKRSLPGSNLNQTKNYLGNSTGRANLFI